MQDLENVFTFTADPFASSGTGEFFTNGLDLGAAGLQVGSGAPIIIKLRVTTSLASATGTLLVQLVEDTTDPIATSPDTILDTAGTGAMGQASWAKGQEYELYLPQQGLTTRYIGLLATIATAQFTAGAISAWIATEYETNLTADYPGITEVTGF